MKTGMKPSEMATAIRRNSAAKDDILTAPYTWELKTSPWSLAIGEAVGGESEVPGVQLIVPQRDQAFDINEVGHEQIASLVGMPTRFYRSLGQKHPELLVQNVNTLLRDIDPGYERQLRTLHGTARAVLSPSYRAMDNDGILDHIFPMLMKGGLLSDAVIASCDITDRFARVKLIIPSLTAKLRVGQTMQVGAVIENSEVGLSKLRAWLFVNILECLNGQVSTRQVGFFSRRHIGGGRPTITTVGNGSDYARELLGRQSTKQLYLDMGKSIADGLSENTVKMLAEPMQAAMQVKLQGSPDAAVAVVGKRFGLTEKEQRAIVMHILNGTATGDGNVDMTIWGVQAAITRYSQDVASYDRASELEAIGGNVIDLKPNEWRVIAEATRTEKAEVIEERALAIA